MTCILLESQSLSLDDRKNTELGVEQGDKYVLLPVAVQHIADMFFTGFACSLLLLVNWSHYKFFNGGTYTTQTLIQIFQYGQQWELIFELHTRLQLTREVYITTIIF